MKTIAGDGTNAVEWPCRTTPVPELPSRLVSFLYVLIRDGASAPGDIEQVALSLAPYEPGTAVEYSNPHIEAYARALATYLQGLEG